MTRRLALARARLVRRGAAAVLILGLDALLILPSLYVAYLLRFDGPIPPEHRAILWRFLPLFLVIRLSLHLAFGLHRWSFRLSGLHEALRVVSATLARHGRVRGGLLLPADAGAAALGAGDGVLPDRQPGGRLPLLAAPRPDLAARAIALALGHTQAHAHRRRRLRRRPAAARPAALGRARLRRRRLRGRRPAQVGPVDRRPPGARADRRSCRRSRRSREVEQLLFAIPRMPAERLREILAACAELKLSYKILPVSFAYLNDRADA